MDDDDDLGMMQDLSAFDEGQPTNLTTLGPLLKLAGEALALEAEVEDLEELLKAKKGRANEIKTQLMPDAMAAVGLAEFKTPDGATIKVEDFVSGSLPKEPDRRERAIHLLEDYGADGLVRNEISIEFEKSQHNEAMALAQELRDKGFDCAVESSVHPQTLMAFVRERLRTGEAVDAEALGCFVGRKAKYSIPGKKQRRSRRD